MQTIGISGVAGSGKSTCGEYLRDHYGFSIMAFADPIKEICARVFDFSPEQLYGDEKEAIDVHYGVSARQVMQQLGTEWGREIFPDVWVELFQRERPANQKPVVVVDVRFPNEVKVIQEMGGHVIRLARGEDAAHEEVAAVRPLHESETALLGYDNFDARITSGTHEELYADLHECVMKWRE